MNFNSLLVEQKKPETFIIVSGNFDSCTVDDCEKIHLYLSLTLSITIKIRW